MQNNYEPEANYLFVCKSCNGVNVARFSSSLKECVFCNTRLSPKEKIYRLNSFTRNIETKEVICPYCNAKNTVNTGVEAVICKYCKTPFSFPDLNLLV